MELSLGPVLVQTIDGRGPTVPELAARCAQRIVYVGDSAPPVIREQARAFQSRVEQVILSYMTQVVDQERNRIARELELTGQHDAAQVVRDL